jgi:hypothetical protein
MADGRRRALLVGSLGAVVVLAALVALVGADDIVAVLRSADPFFVGVTAAFALSWLAAWSLMLRTVLGSLDVRLPVVTSFFVYTGAVFANNVTPFGQAGGEPVAALLISDVSDCRYETGLAGIASVDVINVVPSLSLVVVGVGYYATTAAVGSRLGTAVTSARWWSPSARCGATGSSSPSGFPASSRPWSAGSGAAATTPRRSNRRSRDGFGGSSPTSNG